MYGHKFINGSVECLRVPSFLRNDGPSWADNIFCTSLCWVVEGTYEIWALEVQPGGRYGSVDVLWRGAVPYRPSYLPWSTENVRATARRVHDDLLWEHRLACSQSLSDSRNILGDELVNWTDCALDDLWDKPILQ